MDIFDALWFECVSDYFSLVDADVSIVFDLSPMLEFLINLVRIGGNRWESPQESLQWLQGAPKNQMTCQKEIDGIIRKSLRRILKGKRKQQQQQQQHQQQNESFRNWKNSKRGSKNPKESWKMSNNRTGLQIFSEKKKLIIFLCFEWINYDQMKFFFFPFFNFFKEATRRTAKSSRKRLWRYIYMFIKGRRNVYEIIELVNWKATAALLILSRRTTFFYSFDSFL